MVEKFKNNEQYKQSDAGLYSVQFKPLRSEGGVCCPNCKATVTNIYELCPHCGYRLHNSHCTYCGAPMTGEDLYCGECGGYSKGTPCPSCGTISFRSFCPNCNMPVDELGKEESKKAKADPLFNRICALAEKIIATKESGHLIKREEDSLSPEILSLLQRYSSICCNTPDDINNHEDQWSDAPHNQSEAESLPSRIVLSDSSDDIPDISSAIEELNELIKSMVPDPGLTPQMQRNYYSARKVAVYRKSIVRETVGWVCNLCGCHHGSPSECARPELGGTWIYQDKEITTKTYE